MKRQRLGQHYLVDAKVIRRIVAFARVGPSERVLEIGTGRGELTRELVGLGASLVGYEVDRRNFAETEAAVRRTKARIQLADAFKQRPEFDVLVSSLPYSQSAPFVEWLSGLRFNRAVVVLQEDFVRKILAPPGDRNYRGVSAIAQLSFDIRVLERVGRRAFSPQPRVTSAIVSFSPRLLVSKAEVSNILRLFSLRRRQVDSALAELGMKGRGNHGQRRVFSLKPDEVHELCRSSLK